MLGSIGETVDYTEVAIQALEKQIVYRCKDCVHYIKNEQRNGIRGLCTHSKRTKNYYKNNRMGSDKSCKYYEEVKEHGKIK